MNRTFKTLFCRVELSDNTLFIKSGLIKVTVELGVDMLKLKSYRFPTTFDFGIVKLYANGKHIEIYFTKKNTDELYDFCRLIRDNEVKADYLIKNGRFSPIKYIGGHPGIPRRGMTYINIYNNRIEITTGIIKEKLYFDEIKKIKLEVDEEFKSRFTLTRFLAFGLPGLLLKKTKIIVHQHLIIGFIDDLGYFQDITFKGKHIPTVYNNICKAIDSY